MTTVTVNKSRCKDCGAVYTNGCAAKQMHTASTGHSDWQGFKETYEKESQATYL